MRKYLTVNEVARSLDISTRTVYRLLESGELPGIKTGRVWRVSHDDLDSFINRRSNIMESDLLLESMTSYGLENIVLPFEVIDPAVLGAGAAARILLEVKNDSGGDELYALPLEVVASGDGLVIWGSAADGRPSELVLCQPSPVIRAVFCIFRADPLLWREGAKAYRPIDASFDWQALFAYPGFDLSQSAALKWAYHLNDPAGEHPPGAELDGDRLKLLTVMDAGLRSACLDSLAILHGDK